ncbi:hypothetical protein ABZ128_09800 [Streptomyces sp. NPDC006326]|uniref:hypothetical protein n=1 Tax=Streptomyces sp. NPDC006326 TaxID=3156752 RepID=UPI00339E7891
MITQGVQTEERCGRCGGVLRCDIGQFIERGMVRWGSEGWCEGCPDGWCEHDGGSATPEHIRQALLEAHGLARLRLVETLATLVPVLKGLREAQQLSLGEARRCAAELVDTGLFGTLVEIEFLAIHLRRQNIAVTVDHSVQ